MIYLIGFMGVGKTTIGEKLAKKLNLPFLDTDQEIEKKEQKTITDIFNKHGEIYFRKLEQKLISQIKRKQVIACGGGTPTIHNINYLNNSGINIYLKASPEFLLERLNNQGSKRPLINHLQQYPLLEFIKKKLKERKKIYNKASYIIDVENKKTNEILREINALIRTA